MGVSLGGRIALFLALKRPELVKSLILVSTGARVPDTLGCRLCFSLLEIPRRVGAARGKYPQPYYAYMRQRKASQGFDSTGRLREIKAPSLILHGREDRLAPYEWAKEMYSGIAGSEMKTFKGGHLFLFWRQKEFLDAVEGFLASQEGKPSS